MKQFYKFILFLGLAISVSAQTETPKGIELYEKGDYQNAIVALGKSENVKDLHYLGLSYEKIGKINKAQGAYEESFKKSYKLFFATFDEWQTVEYSETKKLFSDLLKELKTEIDFGYASAANAYKLKSNIFQQNEWRIKAKVLFDAKNLASSGETIFFKDDKALKPMNIVEKPRVGFPKNIDGSPNTPSDMRVNLTKIVTISMIFGADGKLKLLMPADKDINVLTIAVLNNLEKIIFTPATKDDKAVSVHGLIQYSFTML